MFTEEYARKMLAKLYKKVLDNGVRLRISLNGLGNPDGEEASYSPYIRYQNPSLPPIAEPNIEIFQFRALGWVDIENLENFAAQSHDPKNELIVLAHEYGHFLSDKNGDRAEHYDRIIKNIIPIKDWPSQPPEDRKTILKEEKIAWEYGKKTLSDLGFLYWDVFNTKCSEALKGYYNRLRIADGSEESSIGIPCSPNNIGEE